MTDSGTDVQESRRCERFRLDPPVEGSFGGSTVRIVDLAQIGVRIEHSSPVKPRTMNLIAFRIAGVEGFIRLRAEVIWSRLSQKTTPEGKLLYLSGLEFLETDDVLSEAIELLVKSEKARPDDKSLEKKRAKFRKSSPETGPKDDRVKVIRQRRRIDEDTLLLVRQAWDRMQKNPDEAKTWYHRGKHSMKDEEMPPLQNTEEVLAIWEYLERMVQLETIDWVLENEHLV